MKKWRKIFGLVVGATFCLYTQCFAADEDLTGKLFIAAVNPGYSSNTGEMIELKKLSDNFLSLAGVSLLYVNSDDVEYTLYEFDNGDEMTGESLLMRYKSAPDANDNYDAVYSSRSLVQAGGAVRLIKDEEIIDEVCWGNVAECSIPKFTSGSGKTLVRDLGKIGAEDEFSFITDYLPKYDPEKPSLVSNEEQEEIEPQCRNLKFSELLSYYETSKIEQFIEFFNDGDEQILLDGCLIRYKNKTYGLTGIIQEHNYFVRYLNDFSISKNPSSENKIEIIDTDGQVVDTLIYFNGQKKGVSFAQIGYDNDGKEQWLQTYKVTPGEANEYQKWKTCTEGKVINEETGNCVNATTVDKTLEECPAGKYRNPLTNRCKSYGTTTAAAELKPCADGYERNPETNRCRKITTNTGADYAIEQKSFEEKSNFMALWAVIVVLALGVGYVGFQYRKEIVGLFRKK